MRMKAFLLLGLATWLLAACQPAPATETGPAAATLPAEPALSQSISAAPADPALSPPVPAHPVENKRLDDPRAYNFPQLLPFDAILPVYRPDFAPAEAVALLDDELVLGVAWGGQAKAYSVTVLRHREMVNDELAGIPILVTW